MNLGALDDLLRQASGLPGVWYRIVERDFASEIDEVGHTVLYPGRYHPRGEFPVLYLAVSSICAYREKLRQVHGRAEDLLPLVVGAFDVHVTTCLDLGRAEVRQDLEVTLDDLLAPGSFSVPQAVARAARRAGFEAIHTASAASADCRNLVVFKDRLLPSSRCLLDRSSVRPYP